MKKDNKKPELEDDGEDEIIVLEGDEGETEFLHIATLDVDKKWYAMLQPVDLEKFDGMTDDEVLLFEIIEDGKGGEDYKPVTDEKIMDAVYAEYLKEVGDEPAE